MLENYFPILIVGIVALILAAAFLILSKILGPFRPNKNKLDPYESGMDPVGEAKDRYSISFYLVAMEFIVFDLEVIFIYPWAVRYLEFGVGTFMAMMLFIVILFVGLLYTLKKGTLDWDLNHFKA
ncbi:MAG: NADH-quinone oxidoreductase subunit A [Gracilimonas sp.]|uniref:NADH-quinone oxidoreductase subunit A n=1 Tax=Gracilimonas sediminicola TaxID=2952158 RepID=A0A9X2RIF3_9BACT|nr:MULTISPECIES: NADH-quinone oxidoreductase subunit A [Gracilimonas]MBO6586499.1 NADH-quinone oxidoreductase subunit A [Gracilimonas sp.]MBO6615156.1 NADH-quinone oxidoreductase subunit A [Gracilimonas sp.]MCP9292829.1 NADH-quinone oxidoreductase subunit A [Gracilimonas sediminicola]